MIFVKEENCSLINGFISKQWIIFKHSNLLTNLSPMSWPRIHYSNIAFNILPIHNNNNNNWILPGLICPTELWCPGTAQDLPTHWPGTRVWTRVCGGNVPYAVEGRNFHGPQSNAAWLFLTVFIALTGFPYRVFPLWPDVRDSPTSPGWLTASWDSMGNCRPASISLHG